MFFHQKTAVFSPFFTKIAPGTKKPSFEGFFSDFEGFFNVPDGPSGPPRTTPGTMVLTLRTEGSGPGFWGFRTRVLGILEPGFGGFWNLPKDPPDDPMDLMVIPPNLDEVLRVLVTCLMTSEDMFHDLGGLVT